ncbi:MAG: hypothetical protein PWP16_1881 [Eubacteriaceae bacterium]|nr:hypothetical protein [Eubacteriaceae bacterium]MDK2936784.1 hypothetical protein [Eubacteriaceae bacterium]MDN5308518.1 hypothetical protein [Eubacteriaceae bacterium]
MNILKTSNLLYHYRDNRSVKEIARKIGVSVTSLRNYESGKSMPRDAIKEKLARIYNKSVQELFYPDF